MKSNKSGFSLTTILALHAFCLVGILRAESGAETPSQESESWIPKKYCSFFDANYVLQFYSRIADDSASGYVILVTTDHCGKCKYLEEVLETAIAKLDKMPNYKPPKCFLYQVVNRNEVFPRMMRLTQIPAMFLVNNRNWAQASNSVNYTADNIVDLITDPSSAPDEFIGSGRLPPRLPTALDNLAEWYQGMVQEFSGMVGDIFEINWIAGYLLVGSTLLLGGVLLYAAFEFGKLFTDTQPQEEDDEFKIKLQPVVPPTPGTVTPARKPSEAESEVRPNNHSEPPKSDNIAKLTPEQQLHLKKNK